MKKESYLCLEGKKIPLSEEQVRALKGEETRLGDLEAGQVFKLGDYEFIVLEHGSDTTAVILKDTLGNSAFGSSNNDFRNSIVKNKLEAFGKELAKFVDEDDIVTHTADLTSDDGLKDYGKVSVKVSLLTTEQYRRYVEILDKQKLDKWWWLITPDSTPAHGCESFVKCVSPRGVFDCDSYDYDVSGVRPFCIFNSNIFVS